MSVTEATLFTMTILFTSGHALRGENVSRERVEQILEECERQEAVVAVSVEMQDSVTIEHPDTPFYDESNCEHGIARNWCGFSHGPDVH